MSLLQRLTPKIDCSCNGEYKHSINGRCWKISDPTWSSLDFMLPCYIKIGGSEEGFGEMAFSISRLIIVVLIIGLVLWLVFGNDMCPHRRP